MKKEDPKEQQDVVMVPTEYMIDGIKGAVKAMHQMLRKAEKEYGMAYNRRNDYVITKDRVKLDDSEAVLREYDLIRAKKSNQPASVRRVIVQIGDNAARHAYARYVKEVQGDKVVKI